MTGETSDKRSGGGRGESSDARGLVTRSLGAHGAIGLLAGAMLYLVCLSGMLVVVHHEWQRWEQPDIAEMEALSPAAMQRAMGEMLAAERAEGLSPTTHLYLATPAEDMPRGIVTTDHGGAYIGEDGSLQGPEATPWTQFLIDMHYYLHLPSVWGMTLVGALGAMMVALALTGVLAHPRIFRDAFRMRVRGQARVALTDIHNRLSVWTLPLATAVSLTGAIIGLSIVTSFTVAGTWFGGDQTQVYTPIFGGEAAPDPAPAPLPDVAAALEDAAARMPDVVPGLVIAHDPGTAGQHVQVMGAHERRLIFGEYYNYDAAGNYEGRAGLADGALGQQAASSVYRLHFGNFGGLPIKLVYVLLGLAMTVISGSGVSIWLAKRRQKGLPAEHMQGAWSALVWGAPALIAAAAGLRLIGGATLPLTALFWAAQILLVGIGIWRPAIIGRGLRGLLALLLLLVGSGHALAHPGASQAALILDGLIILSGLLCALSLRRAGAGKALVSTGKPAGSPA